MTAVMLLGAGVIAALFAQSVERPATATPIRVGQDGGSGRDVATFDDALRVARTLRADRPDRPVFIDLPAGTWRPAVPIRIGTDDSGTPASPLVVRGAPDGTTTLSGAVVLDRAPTGTRQRFDLRKTGAAMPPVVDHRFGTDGEPWFPLLYQGDRALPVASWPQDGYAPGWQIRADGTGYIASAPRAAPAMTGNDMLLSGFIAADWAFEAFSARAGAAGPLVSQQRSALPIGPAPRLRAMNVPGALATGLFVYAPAEKVVTVMAARRDAPLEAASLSTVLQVDAAHDIVFERIAIEKSAATTVIFDHARNITLRDCFVGHAGSAAIEVRDGQNVRIDSCVIRDTGSFGVRMTGGDRRTLTGAGNRLTNSIVEDVGRDQRASPGVQLWGVGGTIANTLFGHMPHSAITLQGNDHRIHANEIAGAVCETGDSGAIYMGRDWTQRGMILDGNYIHDIGAGTRTGPVMGIYLDDQFSGASIRDNIFFRIQHGVLIGGGRDTTIQGNLFAMMGSSALYLDQRGLDVQRDFVAPGGALRVLLDQQPYREPIWRKRYPTLATVLDNQPGAPVGNTAGGNRYIQSARLWASPATLTLAGTDEVTASPDRPALTVIDRTTGDDRLAVLRRFLPRDMTVTPGPLKRPFYASRARMTKSCTP